MKYKTEQRILGLGDDTGRERKKTTTRWDAFPQVGEGVRGRGVGGECPKKPKEEL